MVSVCGVLLAGASRPGGSFVVDIGTPGAARLTGGGFGRDESTTGGDRTFVWVESGRARVRLPRAGWTDAVVRIAIRPYEPVAGLRQTVAAAINGQPIGTAALRSGWQDIEFQAPRGAWNYGFNVLDLYFSYSLNEPPPSTRAVSVGIDRISVE